MAPTPYLATSYYRYLEVPAGNGSDVSSLAHKLGATWDVHWALPLGTRALLRLAFAGDDSGPRQFPRPSRVLCALLCRHTKRTRSVQQVCSGGNTYGVRC